MAINNISRAEFSRLLPLGRRVERFIGKEIEWFSNNSGKVIGVIAVDRADKGWNSAVLERDKSGDFRVLKLGGDASSLDDARTELLADMAGAEKSQKKVRRCHAT